MLQIGICDDEPLLLEEIRKITDNALKEQQTFAVISTYKNGKELFFEIQDGKKYDLLLLDIEMPDLSGMELAEQIHGLLPDALIIFVTAHYKYAIDAYALNIFRYIPKNQLAERLPYAIKDAVALLEIQNTDSYIISNQNHLVRLPLKDILYIEKDGKNSVFHTLQSTSKETAPYIRKTLSEVYSELNPDEFYFIERGFIVNLRHVTGITRSDCILSGEISLPISSGRLTDFKKKLNKFWRNKI